MNHPFSHSGTLSRRNYLVHSSVAALIFVLALVAMQCTLAATLSPFLGPLFALIALAIICVACASSPLVMPLGSSLLALLATSAPDMILPRLTQGTGLPLALLFFFVVVASLLRLMALTTQRRREAGKKACPAFALPAVFYVGGIALACGLLSIAGEGWAIFMACCLPAWALQLWLLLRPGRSS